MTPHRETLIRATLRERLLRLYQMTGPVRFVEPLKVSFRQ